MNGVFLWAFQRRYIRFAFDGRILQRLFAFLWLQKVKAARAEKKAWLGVFHFRSECVRIMVIFLYFILQSFP